MLLNSQETYKEELPNYYTASYQTQDSFKLQKKRSKKVINIYPMTTKLKTCSNND